MCSTEQNLSYQSLQILYWCAFLSLTRIIPKTSGVCDEAGESQWAFNAIVVKAAIKLLEVAVLELVTSMVGYWEQFHCRNRFHISENSGFNKTQAFRFRLSIPVCVLIWFWSNQAHKDAKEKTVSTPKVATHLVEIFKIYFTSACAWMDKWTQTGSMHSVLKGQQLNIPSAVCTINVNQRTKEKENHPLILNKD